MAAPASYSRRSFVGNAAATTVPLGLGAADGSCTIASATNWPSGSGGDFLVVIDRGQNTEELAWSSGVSGTTLTFALRGAQGTSGVAHAAGCTIALSMGSQDLDEANQVVAAVLGQSGAAKGDILYMLSAAGPNTLSRLAVGSNSVQWLGAAAGVPAWGIAPMTTAGDIMYASSSSAAARLALGTKGQSLVAGASAPTWSNDVPVFTTDTTALSTGSPLAAPGPYGIQSGVQSVTFSAGVGTLTYPTAYPAGCLVCLCQDVGTGSVVSIQVESTRTAATLYCTVAGVAYGSSLNIQYFALGW